MPHTSPTKTSPLIIALLVVSIGGVMSFLGYAGYQAVIANTAPGVAPMPTGPISVEVNDPDAEFFYVDWQRGLRSAKTFNEIPPANRGAVAVLHPRVANSQQYFVADFMETPPNGWGTAQPMSPTEFQDLANVVAKASFLGEDTTLAATFIAIEVKESKLLKKKRRKKKKLNHDPAQYRLEKLLPVLIPLL